MRHNTLRITVTHEDVMARSTGHEATPALIHRGREREDGAVAIIVAICLLLLFGAGAIAIDLGSAWETQRELVVETDAAALAGAQAFAAEGTCAAAETAAQTFLQENGPSSLSTTDYSINCQPLDETVRVELLRDSQQTLSGAIGRGPIEVFGASTAVVDRSTPVGSLRPIALCKDEPVLSQVLDGTMDPPQPLVVSMEKTWKNPACGGASGDWGWLCFDKTECSGNSFAGLRGFLEDGYHGDVTLGGPGDGDEDCAPSEGGLQDCDPKNGKHGQSQEEILERLMCPDGDLCQAFSLLVTDEICESHTSSSACNPPENKDRISPYAFVSVKLTGFCYAPKKNDPLQARGDLTLVECQAAALGDNNPLIFKFQILGVATSGIPPTWAEHGGTSATICADEAHNVCPGP